MKQYERITIIIMLCVISVSNVVTPLAYATELNNPLAPVTIKNTIESAHFTDIPMSGQNGILASSTSLLTVANKAFETRDSAFKHIQVQMQKLEKKVYDATEDVTVGITNPDNESLTTAVVDEKGNTVQVPIVQSDSGNTTDIQLLSSNTIKPGLYKVMVTDQEKHTIEQDFTWGVLAMNTDKSIYHPHEKANFAFAVLNNKGDMVCNADVKLEVRNEKGEVDELSTNNGKITVNRQCQSHDFSLTPDYQATYQFGGPGSYNFQLSAITDQGTHQISETIQVKDQIPFDVQRSSATRIYPPNTYPMIFNVTANRDFTGTVTETVPESFTITPATQSAETSYTNMQTMYIDPQKDPTQELADVLGSATSQLVMPFQGNFPITQGFGTQLTDSGLQAFYTHFGLAGHDGIDFGLPMNTPLYAVDDGDVVWAGPGDYGTMVTIQHSWGKTYYGHMSNTSVTVGQHVSKGQLIGYSGMSGEATGPHLHFGMKPNNPDMNNGYYGKIDAMPYLPFGHVAQATTSIGPQISLAHPAGVNTAVLGTTTAASPSASSGSSASSSATVSVTPPPDASVSATPTVVTPTPTPTTKVSTPLPRADNENFSVLDKEIQLNEQLSNNTQTEKVKVITWHVSLKKGESTSLGYQYQTPKISPQFYLLGPLRFYSSSSDRVVFQEQRQWQIANDDVGVEWFQDTTGPKYNGYSWQYRKKLIIDHTKTSSGLFNNNRIAPTFMESGTDATRDTSFYPSITGTCASDTAITAETGTRELSCTSGSAGAASYVETQDGVMADTGSRISMYVNIPAFPTGNLTFMQIKTSTSTSLFAVRMDSTGTLNLVNNAGTVLGTTGQKLQTGTWYRIGVSYTITSTTVYTINLYVNGVQQINDVCSSCGTAVSTTGSSHLRFGWPAASVGNSLKIYFDDIYIDKGNDLADPGDIHVTNKRPFANGATNGFGTQIGVGGGSGYGSGHAPQVNEQPLSIINGWSTTTPTTNEEYTVEGASVGDVDVSGASLVSDESWAYFNQATAACTGKIWNNGSSPNISLSSGINTVASNSANITNFPSGNQAVGIQSCGANTLSLYEAGLLIAYIPASTATYTPTAISPTFMDPGGDATNTDGTKNFANLSTATNPGGFYASDATVAPAVSITDCATTRHTGPCSYKFSNSTTNKAALVTPSVIAGSTSGRISMWMYFDSFPTGTNVLPFMAVQSAGNVNAFSPEVDAASGDKLKFNTISTATGTTTLQTGTWYRISVAYTILSTTNYKINMYLNGHLEIALNGGTALSTSSLDHYRIGNLDNQDAATTIHIDDIYADDSTGMDDTGDIRVTAKLPIADGASVGYTHGGSAGGTACTTGTDCQYINERALNTTDNLSSTTANARENFTLQNASQGDVDISNAGIVADSAWVYAHTSSACSGLITNNGVDSSIALATTTDTMFTSLGTNANFLSGNQGVGIQNCAAGTVTLEEAGMLVAYTPNDPANTLTNFPVLVNFTSDANLSALAQASGNDIVFTDSTGRNLLNYEIENYSAGTLNAWVEIPALSTATDTVIYMYYGNPAATSKANVTGTWNGSFQGVYHLNDNAANNTVNDSTGVNGGAASANTTTLSQPGQIANALKFTKSSSTNVAANTLAGNLATGSATMSFWINPTLVMDSTHTASIAAALDTAAATNTFVLENGQDCTAGKFCLDVNAGNGTSQQAQSTETSWAASTWFFITGVLDTMQGMQLYVNGNFDGNNANTNRGTSTLATNFEFGGSGNTGHTDYLNAKLDEVRVSTGAKTPGWVYTEYQNENSPSTFISVGTSQENLKQEDSNYAPSLDKLMRHGQFFDSTGAIQPFTF